MFEQIRKQFNKITSTKSLETLAGVLPFNIGEYKTDWGKADFLRAYEISIYANKCIDKRADKVGEVEFALFKGDEKILNDPNLQVLRNPNKILSGEKFWSLVQRYYDIFGEVYLIKEGNQTMTGYKMESLHVLRSDQCIPKFNLDGSLQSVVQKTPKGETTWQGEQVIYYWNPDPKNPLRGMSLLRAGVRAIETGIQIDEYHSKVLQNGGRIEGVFTFKHANLTKEQLTTLKAQYEDQYATASKSGKPLFLGGDSEYQKMGLTPTELSYLETKNVTLEDILMLTGVPKVILGSFDGIKYDNADAAIRVFLKETIKPLLNSLARRLDSSLYPDSDLTLTFIDPTPEDREQTLKEIESGVKNYYMTTNEARALSGLDPIDGGDVILRPMNLITGDEVQEPTPTKSLEVKKKNFVHPLSDYDARRAYEKIAIKRLNAAEKKIMKVAKTYFKAQEDRIIDSVSPEMKHVFRKKDLIGEVFNMQVEVKLAKATFLPVLTEILNDAGIGAKTLLGSDFSFMLTSEISSWLDQKSGVFAQQINDTTFKKLQGEFTESFSEGETRTQLVERIENTYGDISKTRAETIARTETNGVMQKGTFEAYKQANLPFKVWVTVGDDKVRPSHQITDGEERALNDSFSNGLLFPSDPSGSAGETINCRCVI